MKKTRIILTLMMIFFLLFSFHMLFAAGEEGAPPGEEILITIWKGPNTDHDPEIYADVIGAFEAKHPGVNVELIPTPWASIAEKYGTAFAAGTNPDIIYGFTGGYVDAVMPKCHDYREIFTKKELDSSDQPFLRLKIALHEACRKGVMEREILTFALDKMKTKKEKYWYNPTSVICPAA